MTPNRRDILTMFGTATFLPVITATATRASDADNPVIGIQWMSTNEPTDKIWSPLVDGIVAKLRRPLTLKWGRRARINELITRPTTALFMADFIAVTRAIEQLHAIPIATVNRDFTGSAVSAAIITLADSPIRTASDIRGKRLGLQADSMRTRLLPQEWLARSHVDLDAEVTTEAYDTWGDIFLAVINRKVDVGAIGSSFIEGVSQKRPQDISLVRVLDQTIDSRTKLIRTTAAVPDLTLCAMPPFADLVAPLSQHLLGITDKAPQAQAAHIKGFVPPMPLEEYAPIVHRLNLA